jgi:molybdate transport system ATP-binding protein
MGGCADRMSLRATITRQLSPAFGLDVNVDAPPGITILFGPSGSGKSTLLRCIAGLSRPDAGRIMLDNAVLFDATRGIDVPPQRRKVGVVFQQLALFPHLTVAGNIAYGLHRLSASERRARIASVAETFHITALLGRRPAQISGGERQRTALARALVTEPSALLLDEPLSALDHRIQSQIIDDLRRWNEARRIPVLYVTHAHREVYALGERVIVLDHGTVVATGTPHEVLDDPGRGMIAEVAGFENLLTGQIVARRQDTGTMSVQLDEVRVTCPPERIERRWNADTTAPPPLTLDVPLTTTVDDRVTVAIRAGDILVATTAPVGISARNIIEGSVDRMQRQGPTVVAHVSAAVPFIVHLTPGSVVDLNLQPGSRVWLIIKTYSCRIGARVGRNNWGRGSFKEDTCS